MYVILAITCWDVCLDRPTSTTILCKTTDQNGNITIHTPMGSVHGWLYNVKSMLLPPQFTQIFIQHPLFPPPLGQLQVSVPGWLPDTILLLKTLTSAWCQQAPSLLKCPWCKRTESSPDVRADVNLYHPYSSSLCKHFLSGTLSLMFSSLLSAGSLEGEDVKGFFSKWS